jgi:flagellar motor switch/type III secretory pathway protein FliN
VGRFGTLALVLEGPAARDGVAPEHVAFGLGRERVAGRVVLDAALAHRLVRIALDLSDEHHEAFEDPDDELGSVGRLGLGARGLVAGFVASALHALAAPLTVALAPPDPATLRAEGTVALALRVTVAGRVGWARLDVPRGWLADAARVPTDPMALGALAVEAVVELGRTTLGARELEALEPGDAVVFDGVRGVRGMTDDEAWPARVVAGGHAAEARVSPDARVTVAREFVPLASAAPSDEAGPEGWEEMFMETRARGSVVNGAPAGETTVLAAALIEVVAELARVTLRGDEVLGLGPGAVLRLAGTRGANVALRVGGELWAEGELVDVDGELGVRVTATRR